MVIEDVKDLEANSAPPAEWSAGLAGAQAAQREKLILNLVPGAAAGEGGASSSASAAAAATPMQLEIPRAMKQVLMADAPTVQEARDFWGGFGSEVQARAKKARIAGVSLDKADTFETVDEHLDPAALDDVMNEATDYDVAEDTRRRNRQEEIEVMAKFKAYEPVDRRAYAGHKILKTRFVDTDEKSRFVAKEYNTGATDEFFAQATMMSTGRLVDALACKRWHSRMILDVHWAFLHLTEEETVLVEPPLEWQESERAAGRDPTRLWRMKKILYGRRKAPKEW